MPAPERIIGELEREQFVAQAREEADMIAILLTFVTLIENED